MKIRGNTVGTTMPRADYAQTDPTKADYIKNKPDLSGIELAQETANYASAVAEGAQSGVDEVTASLENAHSQLSQALDHKVSKSGDTMSGALTVVEPTEAGHAVPKSYVDAKYKNFTATVPTTGWTNWKDSGVTYSYVDIPVSGLLATDAPDVDYNCDATGTSSTIVRHLEWWATVYRAEARAGTLRVFTSEVPTEAIPIKIKVVR